MKRVMFFMLLFVLAACSSPIENADVELNELEVLEREETEVREIDKEVEEGKLRLVSYEEPGVFSMQIPQGWKVQTGGRCTTGAVVVQDPQNPLRQVFYFGSVGPFYLSENQKEIDREYEAMGGYPIAWKEMPVIQPLTSEEFVKNFEKIIETPAIKEFMDDLPELKEVEVLSVESTKSPLPGESALIRALFKNGERIGEGLFHVGVVENVPEMGGPGSGHAQALQFVGVTAESEEFEEVVLDLVKSAESLSLDESYLASCTQEIEEQGRAALKAGKTLQEAGEIITQGWEGRNKVDDILSAKRSDANLGIERVYDPATGEVYQVENDFYSKYENNREKYRMNGLQVLPEKDWKLWTAPTLDGSRIN